MRHPLKCIFLCQGVDSTAIKACAEVRLFEVWKFELLFFVGKIESLSLAME